MSSENDAEDPTTQWVEAGIFPAGLTVPRTQQQISFCLVLAQVSYDELSIRTHISCE